MQTYADAMKLQSIFAGYFAVPLVLAIGVLFLEAGRHNKLLASIGLLAPVVAVWLSLPGEGWSVPQTTFAQTFAATLGSPLFVALLLACMFLVFAIRKRVEGGGVLLSVATLLLTVIGPGSMSFAEWHAPNLWLVLSLAFVHLAIGYTRRSTPQCLLAMTLACFVADAVLSQFAPAIRFGLEVNVVMLAVIAAGVITRSSELQFVGASMATILSAVVLLPIEFVEAVPFGWRVAYAALLFTMVLAIAIRWRLSAFVAACVGTGASLFGLAGYEIWQLIKDIPGVRGLLFYAAGIAWFVLAAGISIAKARQRSRITPE